MSLYLLFVNWTFRASLGGILSINCYVYITVLIQRILERLTKYPSRYKQRYTMGSKFDGNLESLIENNEAWADGQEPGFFSELATQQKPKIVWFGKIDVLKRMTDSFCV